MFRQIKVIWINIQWHDNEDESLDLLYRINGLIKEDVLRLDVLYTHAKKCHCNFQMF